IQGGIGSFNEQAVRHYIQKSGKKYEIRYLHTSHNVLAALHAGEIEQGQFAIHNSIGGIVDESRDAMAIYPCRLIDEFTISIKHALLIRKDAKLSDVTTIMTHPQVLAQCKKTLAAKYPHLTQTSGTAELIDHATVAKQLAEGMLPKHVATM